MGRPAIFFLKKKKKVMIRTTEWNGQERTERKNTQGLREAGIAAKLSGGEQRHSQKQLALAGHLWRRYTGKENVRSRKKEGKNTLKRSSYLKIVISSLNLGISSPSLSWVFFTS